MQMLLNSDLVNYQGKSVVLAFFYEIGLKASFQAQFKAYRTKYISCKPIVSYRNSFRYSSIIAFINQPKYSVYSNIITKIQGSYKMYLQPKHSKSCIHTSNLPFLPNTISSDLSLFLCNLFCSQQLPLAAQPASKGQLCLKPRWYQFLIP